MIHASPRAAGGILGSLLTVLAALAVLAAIALAIDVLVLDSRYSSQLTGNDSVGLFDPRDPASAMSASEAVRIGREEARAVAEETARRRAQIAARDEIAERTGQARNARDAVRVGDGPDVARLVSQLSGSRQIAAKEARRVAEEVAAAIAREEAFAELDRYTDALTAYDPGDSLAAEDDPDAESRLPEADPEDVAEQADATAAPAREPTPPARSDPTPEPAAQTRTASRQPAATPKPAPEPEPEVRRPGPPSALVLKSWWPDPQTVPDGRLAMRYAGEASDSEHGVALLFSDAVASPASAGDHITVRNANGRIMDVTWSAANNPALIRTNALPQGRYVVVVQQSLSSRRGAQLSQRLEGEVYITQ